MKTITRKYEVYNYKELSEKAKEKAREDWNAQNEYEYLTEDLEYKASELLKENKIIAKEFYVQYSLNNCQGDGAIIEGFFKWKKYNIETKQSGRYYHYNSKTLDITDKEGEQADNKVYKEFDDLYIDICVELTEYGYDIIEAARSEENLKDLFKVNEYTFLKNGEMFNQ